MTNGLPSTARWLGLALLAIAAAATPAAAQIAVSANDNKLRLVDGVTTTVPTAPPDTITVIDLSGAAPRVIGELAVPASIVGPPSSVAITPDGGLALVTAAQRLDPADRTRTIPDDTVSLVDLRGARPAVVGTARAGAGASGVSINAAGTLALVANRIEGTVSVFTIAGRMLTPAGKVDLGAPQSGPSHVAITPNGRMALVTRNNDSVISVLDIDGATVTLSKREVGGGLRPYGIEIAPSGDVAISANVGAGQLGGGIDVLNVIDLTAPTPRTIAHVPAGPVVEGIAISPDGRFVAATVMNGSNSPRNAPTFNDFGLVKVFGLANKTLTPVAEARVGHWCQGAAWSRDARTLLVQCAAEREIRVFQFDGRTLTPAPAIAVDGGPSGIRAN